MSHKFNGTTSSRITKTMASPINDALQNVIDSGKLINMGQGMVYWDPPAEALDRSKEMIGDISLNRYGSIEGTTRLRQLLVEKLQTENNLFDRDVMVTAGSNQAYLNVIISLCDVDDEVILVAPYYFNHMMAIQFTNLKPVICPASSDLNIDVDRILSLITPRTKIVSIVSPSNPTGHVYSSDSLKSLQEALYNKGIWLISDEAYEYFVFDGVKHYSPSGDNVINLYSFSKSYGMAGWRVGYIAYPKNNNELKESLSKVQDTVPINACQLSQQLAIAALENGGSEWVRNQVKTLDKNREAVWDVIKDLDGAIKTKGALYFYVKLPDGFDDQEFAKHLVQEFDILIIPCSDMGGKGCIRISYANMTYENCLEACKRLRMGIKKLILDARQ